MLKSASKANCPIDQLKRAILRYKMYLKNKSNIFTNISNNIQSNDHEANNDLICIDDDNLLPVEETSTSTVFVPIIYIPRRKKHETRQLIVSNSICKAIHEHCIMKAKQLDFVKVKDLFITIKNILYDKGVPKIFHIALIFVYELDVI